jgi:hypothetical protein
MPGAARGRGRAGRRELKIEVREIEVTGEAAPSPPPGCLFVFFVETRDGAHAYLDKVGWRGMMRGGGLEMRVRVQARVPVPPRMQIQL